MFKKEELAKIKEDLLIRKKELEEGLESMSQEKISDTGSQDEGDQVMSVTMEALRNSLQDTDYNEYKNILNALKAIEVGNYGICKECGEQISTKRLKYNPNAQCCIDCQQRLEELEQL
ncbi:MAG: molecular chaperone DnaK suppressor DksA [Epsilonproteobacteria bacterium]|nr:molecular chaperone DnaK suppressor DksA [Campylobacterota bacterium]|tara:strand:+ start:3114 stop:3467 length:354 start_codon:yes stop_codon:yes gene_type:complete